MNQPAAPNNDPTRTIESHARTRKKQVRHALFSEDWTPRPATRPIFAPAIGHNDSQNGEYLFELQSANATAATIQVDDLIDRPQFQKQTRSQSARVHARVDVASSGKAFRKQEHTNVNGTEEIMIPCAPQDLSFAEQRLGTLSMFSILEHARYHKILVESASSSIDNKVPVTLEQARKTRNVDLMPDLDLPLGIKKKSGYCTLTQMKSQRNWHNVLISRAKSHTNQNLPKHVQQYQQQRRKLNHKLMATLKRRTNDVRGKSEVEGAVRVGRSMWGLD